MAPPSQGGEDGDRRGLGSCLGEPRLQPAEAVRDPPGGQAGCERPQKIELEADSPDEESERPVACPSQVAEESYMEDSRRREQAREDGQGERGKDARQPRPHGDREREARKAHDERRSPRASPELVV